MTRTGTTPTAAGQDPMAWTAGAQDKAARVRPALPELEEEHSRRQDACALAEAWDEAHAEAAHQARRREAEANAAAHRAASHT